MGGFVAALILACLPFAVSAAGGSMALLDAKIDLSDRASLQRGAKLFVNYCLGCHSLGFMRYDRMGRDLGLSDEQVRDNLLLAGDKVGDEMQVALRRDDARAWFGVAPPDLSVIARSRSPDWLYSYLLTFYQDPNPARPFGVNNLVFEDVGMPHVLWTLQGIQMLEKGERPADAQSEHAVELRPTRQGVELHHAVLTESGREVKVVDRLEVGTPGRLGVGPFRSAARDLVNFLAYVGEPAKLVRYRIGFWVLVYLAVFCLLSYALYREYWKDVH